MLITIKAHRLRPGDDDGGGRGCVWAGLTPLSPERDADRIYGKIEFTFVCVCARYVIAKLWLLGDNLYKFAAPFGAD